MKIFDCFSPFKNDVKEVINGLSGGPKVQSWTDKSVRVVDLNELPLICMYLRLHYLTVLFITDIKSHPDRAKIQ